MIKKKAKPKGKLIRVSDPVYNYLNKKRRKFMRKNGMESSEGFDVMLRREYGLPTRKGEYQPIKTYWILTKPILTIVERLSEAKGEAIIRAVREGKRKAERPIKVKEFR